MLIASGQGSDILNASSSFLPQQDQRDAPREKLNPASDKKQGATFGQLAKIPNKARLMIRASVLDAIPETEDSAAAGGGRGKRTARLTEYDLGECLAKGVAASLQSNKKIFRSDFKEKAFYKPESDAGMFDFQDYAPSVFQTIRQLFGILADSYRESICSEGNLLGGRLSGAQGQELAPFFFSRDKRFLIRAITAQEADFFLKIVDKYFRHITRHPHTLLPRFFGLVELKIPKQKSVRFIIMNNIFETSLPIHAKYDFKVLSSLCAVSFPPFHLSFSFCLLPRYRPCFSFLPLFLSFFSFFSFVFGSPMCFSGDWQSSRGQQRWS